MAITVGLSVLSIHLGRAVGSCHSPLPSELILAFVFFGLFDCFMIYDAISIILFYIGVDKISRESKNIYGGVEGSIGQPVDRWTRILLLLYPVFVLGTPIILSTGVCP